MGLKKFLRKRVGEALNYAAERVTQTRRRPSQRELSSSSAPYVPLDDDLSFDYVPQGQCPPTSRCACPSRCSRQVPPPRPTSPPRFDQPGPSSQVDFPNLSFSPEEVAARVREARFNEVGYNLTTNLFEVDGFGSFVDLDDVMSYTGELVLPRAPPVATPDPVFDDFSDDEDFFEPFMPRLYPHSICAPSSDQVLSSTGPSGDSLAISDDPSLPPSGALNSDQLAPWNPDSGSYPVHENGDFRHIIAPSTSSDGGCLRHRFQDMHFFNPLIPYEELKPKYRRRPDVSFRHQELNRSIYPDQPEVGPHVRCPEDNLTAYRPGTIYYRGNGIWRASMLLPDFFSRSVLFVTFGPTLSCQICAVTYPVWTYEEATWAARASYFSLCCLCSFCCSDTCFEGLSRAQRSRKCPICARKTNYIPYKLEEGGRYLTVDDAPATWAHARSL
ncbi:unnamed protein product [Oikopleura dioica]|uniref:LITAF domain-containing protein n=1 Tax=Oikopleura dioica TaxID=34765 RepID=E4XI50_OIKDI|nr:unnamed protein product [Oikopleura dioica]